MEPDCNPLGNTPGSTIPLADATIWTENYQSAHPNSLRAVYFDASVFTKLLAQPNTTGIRIWLANSSSSSDSMDTMILVSATESEDLTTVGEYELYDYGTQHPPCSVISPLNH